MQCQPIERTETTIKNILLWHGFVGKPHICSEYSCFYKTRLKSHDVCDEPGKQYLSCFCFTELRNSEDFCTCLASVCVKRNSCTSQSCKENRRALKEINQNIEFLSTYSLNVNKKTNKCSFRLQLKIVLCMRFRKLSHLTVTNLNNGLRDKCSFRLHLKIHVCAFHKIITPH